MREQVITMEIYRHYLNLFGLGLDCVVRDVLLIAKIDSIKYLHGVTVILKDHRQLLETVSTSLREETPYQIQPETVQAEEEDVVVVPNRCQRNWVHPHVDDQCNLPDDVLDGETFRAHIEGHDLGGVRVQERVAGHVVHDVEEKQADDNAVAFTCSLLLVVYGAECDEGNEDQDHANVGRHPELAPADAIDNGGAGEGGDKVDDVETTVDASSTPC